MIIDFHHHYQPKEAVLGQIRKGVTREMVYEGGVPTVTLHYLMYQIEERVELMDAAGIDIAVLSGGGAADTLEECRLANDRRAEVARRFPKRFVGLVSVNPFLPRAIEEVKRAVQDLGFRGVHVIAFPGGGPLDSRRLWPFYREVERMGIPIYVHPGNLFSAMALFHDYDLVRTAGREYELSLATTRLVLGRVVEEFPGLKWVISHQGGGVANIKERLDKMQEWGVPLPIEKGFDDSFSRLYFDTAGFAGGMKALNCSLTTISPHRLVFGTDYPQDFVEPKGMKEFASNIQKLPLKEEEKRAILGENAKALLKI